MKIASIIFGTSLFLFGWFMSSMIVYWLFQDNDISLTMKIITLICTLPAYGLPAALGTIFGIGIVGECFSGD